MWILIDFMCNMNIFELLQWWLINEKIYAKNINAIQALEFINIYMKIKKKYYCERKLPCRIHSKNPLNSQTSSTVTQYKLKSKMFFISDDVFED